MKRGILYQIEDFQLDKKIQKEAIAKVIADAKIVGDKPWYGDDTRVYVNFQTQDFFKNSHLLPLIPGKHVQVIGCSGKEGEFGWHTDEMGPYDTKWGCIMPLFQLHQCYLQFDKKLTKTKRDIQEPKAHISMPRKVGELYVADLSKYHRIYNPTIRNKLTLVTALFEFKKDWRDIAEKKGIKFRLRNDK